MYVMYVILLILLGVGSPWRPLETPGIQIRPLEKMTQNTLEPLEFEDLRVVATLIKNLTYYGRIC